MLETLSAAWNGFWFSPASALDLGAARFFIVGYYLLFKLTERPFDFQAWAHVYRIFSKSYPWQTPWLHKILHVSVAPIKQQKALVVVYKIALAMTALGFLTTGSCFVALALGLYLDGLRHGIRNHHTAIPIHFFL